MYTLKIRKIGNSLGVTLPKEALQKLRVQEGDSVFVTETPMEAYRKVSTKYRNALHELGK
jgi:antitoxin component of MazEF toxin-antitoxin module